MNLYRLKIGCVNYVRFRKSAHNIIYEAACILYFIFAAVNPYIIHQPVSQLAVLNCVVNFTCVALAFPPPTYSWITPENSDFNSTTIFWKYEDVKPEFIGDYICAVSSNGVMVRSNTVHLSGMH